jgi:lysozyme
MSAEPDQKALFDAIRRIKRAPLTQADVDEINRALGLPLDPSPEREPSGAAYQVIKTFEGCSLQAYLCPARVWTIGFGATGAGIVKGVRWTMEQAERRLVDDVEAVAAQVRQLIGAAPTTQGHFDALVSFAFNCGTDIDDDHTPEGLGDSTLLKLHLAGDHAGAAAEFGKWVNGGGRKLNGLVRRREAEVALYRRAA